MKNYHLFNFDGTNILFSSYGYLDKFPYSAMKLYYFSNEELGFHILHVSKDVTLLFGNDLSFQEWLAEHDVHMESRRIRTFRVWKKMKDMEALLCTTGDDLILEMTSSYFKDWCSGLIKTKGDSPKSIYTFDIGEGNFLPILTRLPTIKPELVWTEEQMKPGELPPKVQAYSDEIERANKRDSIRGNIYLIVVFLVVAYMVYSCFTADLD